MTKKISAMAKTPKSILSPLKSYFKVYHLIFYKIAS